MNQVPTLKPPAAGVLVSVIVVTCGTNEHYLSCLRSIGAQTHSFLDVILIDNSRDPGVARKAAEVYPALRVHCSPENLFYAAAMNQGIAMSRGAFVLCLNDDVTLDPAFIEQALGGFSVDPRIGMVAGKVFRTDGITLDTTGLFLGICRNARERGYNSRDTGVFDRPGPVFGASGAAAFYRRTMLDAIKESSGWFDAAFGMFFEDMDLAWRANRQGWRGYYVPRAVAYHVRGGTARLASDGKIFARQCLDDHLHAGLIANRYSMMIKNENFFGFFVHLIPVLAYDLCAWGYVLLFRRGVIRIFFTRVKAPGARTR
jgi:GT2 family glycosyltransferase